MLLKEIIDVDYVNYQKPSMILGFPNCLFKCDKKYCQNSLLATMPSIKISVNEVVKRYLKSNSTHAIVCQGLEPLDSWYDLLELIIEFRKHTNDDFVIYTGYTKCEIADKVKVLIRFKNVIIKYGRYIPNQKPHYDGVLGVELASDNQYAEKIS